MSHGRSQSKLLYKLSVATQTRAASVTGELCSSQTPKVKLVLANGKLKLHWLTSLAANPQQQNGGFGG